MKTLNDKFRTSIASNLVLTLLLALAAMSAAAQPAMPGTIPPRRIPVPGTPMPGSSSEEMTNAPSNYLVRVEWRDTSSPTGAVEVLTGEGQFQVSSSLPGSAASGEPGLLIPITLNGTLKVLNPEQGRFELFIGRSVPYSVSSPGQKMSSIQQRQEGMTVTFYVTFGKPVIARRDATGEVSVLVKKQAP